MTSSLPSSSTRGRYLVPYLRLFPIWRFGPRTNLLGDPIPDGWYPDKYGTWKFTTLEEAKAAAAKDTPTT